MHHLVHLPIDIWLNMEYYEIFDDLDRCFGDEYDGAIVGYCIESHQPIYSIDKIARIVMKRAKINYHESIDFIINTMKGCANGSCEPILCMDCDD
jgi:hypothetical protein